MMYGSIEAYSDIADNDFGSFADNYYDAMADMYEEEGYCRFPEDFLRRKITMTKKELSVMKKKTGDELQDFLAFKRRGSVVPAKKGKGSFKRKSKYGKEVDMCA